MKNNRLMCRGILSGQSLCAYTNIKEQQNFWVAGGGVSYFWLEVRGRGGMDSLFLHLKTLLGNMVR